MSASRIRQYLVQLENVESLLAQTYLEYEANEGENKEVLKRKAERILENRKALEAKITQSSMKAILKDVKRRNGE